MKAYMGYAHPDGGQEGACLIFAPDAKIARKLAWPILYGWFQMEWIDVRTKLMRDLPDHLKALDTGKEQVIDSPPSCPNCEAWGGHLVEQEGRCLFCEAEE